MDKHIADIIENCLDVYCFVFTEKYGSHCSQYCCLCDENGDCCYFKACKFVTEAKEKEQEV